MNQILSTEMDKKAKKSKAPRAPRTTNMKSIIIVFGMCLILFGICLAGGGSYAIYQSKFADSTGSTDSTGDTEEQNTVTEDEGDTTEEYNIDISIEAVDSQIKVTVSSEDGIAYVTYKWDSGGETRQDINDTSGEILVDIPEGQHTLTIVAVDSNNNIETKTQEVKGVVKPTLEVTQDGENFVVKMSDETGLDRVEFVLNGQAYVVRLQGVTEREFSYPLDEGQNELTVTLYNTSGATQTFSAEWEN